MEGTVDHNGKGMTTGHTVPRVRERRDEYQCSAYFLFYPVKDTSCQAIAAHIQSGSSHLSKISLETPSQTHPEVYFHRDSKPSHSTVKINHNTDEI